MLQLLIAPFMYYDHPLIRILSLFFFSCITFSHTFSICVREVLRVVKGADLFYIWLLKHLFRIYWEEENQIVCFIEFHFSAVFLCMKIIINKSDLDGLKLFINTGSIHWVVLGKSAAKGETVISAFKEKI